MMYKLQKTFAILALLALVVSGCVAQPGAAPAAAPAASDAAAPATGSEAASSTDLSRPHPLLSNANIRKAIAHCIDRDALIAAVYPYVSDDVKPTLRMDSFLPKTHWAYKGPYTDYAFSAENGAALLEGEGWKLAEGETYRTNADGETLELTFTTTNAQFRQTWAAVVEQQLRACGILMIRQHVPASWWFGDTTGTARRDFELGAFAWVGQADPSGRSLYSCDKIPTPGNNWEGQNGMGWCNEKASNAIVLANNTLVKEERIAAYDIVQQEFGKDMVSLPLFQRAEAEAWGNNLEGLKSDPTEYGTASASNWKLTDGGDTIVVGFSQEPASMFTLVESAAVQRQTSQLISQLPWTQYSYDYQAVGQKQLSTIENGLATNEMVDVKAGDMVYNIAGEPEALAAGTQVIVNGETIEYDGSSPLQLPQLKVTYQLNDYTWEDGTPGSIEDIKLGYQIDCDKDSGATLFTTCESIQNVEWAEGLEWTVTYLPGVQSPTYFLTGSPFSTYPSHQVLSDGRNLKDVPAAEWATLPEIAEKPLSNGSYMLTEWIKGQSITFEANPHANPAPVTPKIIIQIVPDTNQAVAQLLAGDVDYLEKATLGAGAEVQTVVDAAKEGKVKVDIIASPTWEHIDMNMYVKEK